MSRTAIAKQGKSPPTSTRANNGQYPGGTTDIGSLCIGAQLDLLEAMDCACENATSHVSVFLALCWRRFHGHVDLHSVLLGRRLAPGSEQGKTAVGVIQTATEVSNSAPHNMLGGFPPAEELQILAHGHSVVEFCSVFVAGGVPSALKILKVLARVHSRVELYCVFRGRRPSPGSDTHVDSPVEFRFA